MGIHHLATSNGTKRLGLYARAIPADAGTRMRGRRHPGGKKNVKGACLAGAKRHPV